MMDSKLEKQDSYMDRNGRWLKPLLATILFIVAADLAQKFGCKSCIKVGIPWTYFAGTIGFFVTGIYAAFTNTFSARIVRIAGQAAALGMFVLLVLDLIKA
ncbi:hypothetical protein CCU68_06430 [Pseudomonas gingeri NCPPB 3146 = LMG 5327]|uniref:Uncharacterized protein n=2 Tax=Pseudomonas gingeri TaxID=117681 RepID=A0A7Y7Y6E2_9PSED|nr:hypothetical protein [Pseudomonas gingeri]NWC18695.1 hypothetical protein [Pseudomonas gingeri]PNQ93398.1 hypothetical protein CCU68_06430 [Pseudomonas gingeri NCPPB 3146 = LMG 5327]